MKKLILACLLVMTVLLQNGVLAVAQASITLYPAADYYADSKFPRSNYGGGNASILYVGNSYDHVQDIWGSERIFILFDLTGLPKNHVILQATLRLWQTYAPAASQTYETYRVLGSWDEYTSNWNSQPPFASDKTSESVAPAQADVPVEWDITTDVKAWYGGEARNYGSMIRVAKEEHVRDASSGFWSREYPVGSHEEWKPRLIVVLQGAPSSTYAVAIGTKGLPNALAYTIVVDGRVYKSASVGTEEKIIFGKGTTHSISVSNTVAGSPGVRYVCGDNRTDVSAEESLLFEYSVEYLVTFTMDPPGMFETSTGGWYPADTTLMAQRIGPDLTEVGLGTRLVFDGWYVNSQKLTAEPAGLVVSRPIALVGRYNTEYYLEVRSPIGNTEGSGWYLKDSVAQFSVDRATVSEEGFLGLLGLRRSFATWTGSANFLGVQETPQGSIVMKGPATIEAIWQEDWSSVFLSLGVLILTIVAITCATVISARRRRSHHTTKH